MSLSELIKGLLNLKKPLNLETLPSQGLFYKEDFKIWIKRADMEDIIEYEWNFLKDNIGVVINKLKRVVEKNTFFSPGWNFEDIKSIDIVYIFLEIVKFTTGKPIKLSYQDEETGLDNFINFEHESFNYFRITPELMTKFNSETKEFIIDDWRYSLPSIGVENCLTKFLIMKSSKPGADRYNKFNYDFTYFFGNKNNMTVSEIENLIQIFNFDMNSPEKKKIKEIVEMFSPLQRYSLIKDDKVIDINSKINLENIFKD